MLTVCHQKLNDILGRIKMKKLICITAAILLFSTIAFAADYEVVFTVKYNTVSEEEMIKIVKRITALDEDACKVDIKIKKVDSDSMTTTGVWTIHTND